MSNLKNIKIFMIMCMACLVVSGCGIQKDTQNIAHNTEALEVINQKLDKLVETMQTLVENITNSLNPIAFHLRSIGQDLENIETIASHLESLQSIAESLKNIQCEIDGLPLKEWIERMIQFLEPTEDHFGSGEEDDSEDTSKASSSLPSDPSDTNEQNLYSHVECTQIAKGQ